jgi:hypothetical protein
MVWQMSLLALNGSLWPKADVRMSKLAQDDVTRLCSSAMVLP